MRFSRVGIVGTLMAAAIALLVIVPVLAADGTVEVTPILEDGMLAPIAVEGAAPAESFLPALSIELFPVPFQAVTGEAAASARAGPITQVATVSTIDELATSVLRTAVGITLSGLLALSLYLSGIWTVNKLKNDGTFRAWFTGRRSRADAWALGAA